MTFRSRSFEPTSCPTSPRRLELTVIELEDGRSVLAVGLRPGWWRPGPPSSPTSPITAAGDGTEDCPTPTAHPPLPDRNEKRKNNRWIPLPTP